MSNEVPPALTTPISPSCIAMKFLVCRLKAEVSEAINVLPGASPMFMGEPLQATTTLSGSFTDRTATPHVPSHFCKLRLTASRSSTSGWASNSLPMSWAMTSVSVWDRNTIPSLWSCSRLRGASRSKSQKKPLSWK